MNDYEKKVLEFHTAFGGDIDRPFSGPLLELRKSLLNEETRELAAEIDRAAAELRDNGKVSPATLAALLKEMADVQYVLSGMAVTFGLPVEEVFSRVHASNMSKLGDDGKPVLRADGKILKGPRYLPPDLEDIVEKVA